MRRAHEALQAARVRRQLAAMRRAGQPFATLRYHREWANPAYWERYRPDDYRVRWRDRDFGEVLVADEPGAVGAVRLGPGGRPTAFIPEGTAGSAHRERIFGALMAAMEARGG